MGNNSSTAPKQPDDKKGVGGGGGGAASGGGTAAAASSAAAKATSDNKAAAVQLQNEGMAWKLIMARMKSQEKRLGVGFCATLYNSLIAEYKRQRDAGVLVYQHLEQGVDGKCSRDAGQTCVHGCRVTISADEASNSALAATLFHEFIHALGGTEIDAFVLEFQLFPESVKAGYATHFQTYNPQKYPWVSQCANKFVELKGTQLPDGRLDLHFLVEGKEIWSVTAFDARTAAA